MEWGSVVIVGMRMRAAALVALAVVSTLGLNTIFDSTGFLIPAFAGALGSALVMFVAWRCSLFTGETIASSVLGFLIVGPVAVSAPRSLPDPLGFLAALVHVWADVLSSPHPSNLTADRRVVPFAVGWMGVVVGGTILRRLGVDRSGAFPLIGPLLGLAVIALLGAEPSGLLLLQGAAFGVAALVLAAGVIRPASLAMITAITVVAAMSTWVTTSDFERFDLADSQDRPWDPLSVPSPLVTIKANLKEGRNETVVFTVESDEPITRWTSSVLGHYNGTVWTVGQGSGTAASFEPIEQSTTLTRPTEGSISYRLTVVDSADPWVPLAGRVEQIVMPPGQSVGEYRLDRQTDVLVRLGDQSIATTVAVDASPVPEYSDLELLSMTVSPAADDAELGLLPPQMRNLAGDLFEGVEPGMARAVTLKNRFQLEGFYDSGDRARPGHSLARLAEFLDEPDRLVGYSEQYAAAAAVLARIGGLSTRVVVGYRLEESDYATTADGRFQADVVADDASAWIEVLTDEAGWVALDVTPDRTREPQPEQLGVTINDVVIPNPPPPPPPPPDRQPTSRTDEGQVDDEPEEDDEGVGVRPAWQTVAIASSGMVLMPVVLLAALGGLVIWLKRRRSSQRRLDEGVEAVRGAWGELVDRYRELGVDPKPSATPSEAIAHYIELEPRSVEITDELEALAEAVDRATFHHTGPDHHATADAWQRCERASHALRTGRTRRERFWMATDPRPLLKERTHDRQS